MVIGDFRDRGAFEDVLKAHTPFDVVLHLAAQVAVTTSVLDPGLDFEVNALGTFNVLEAVRHSSHSPIVLYASTNKVYGVLKGYEVEEADTRCPISQCSPRHSRDGSSGLPFALWLFESRRRSVRSGLPSHLRHADFVFRNSCIYAPRQFGVEDQGWLAWLVIAAARERSITILGDGKQVRDVLSVDDLVEAMVAAVEHAENTQGQIYSLGRGPGRRNSNHPVAGTGTQLAGGVSSEVVGLGFEL